ncbi:MAG: DUF5519 family protein [Meiothermus sp.]|nr:DUF5519 family protein [Meiothermus sp.]
MPVNGAAQQVEETLTQWEGVEAVPHRFGGREYRIGKRELGHIHGDRLVDIPFPIRVRDEVVAAGLAERHHILPDSGWVSKWLRVPEDVATALELLRRSYQLALEQKARRELRAAGSSAGRPDAATEPAHRG